MTTNRSIIQTIRTLITGPWATGFGFPLPYPIVLTSRHTGMRTERRYALLGLSWDGRFRPYAAISYGRPTPFGPRPRLARGGGVNDAPRVVTDDEYECDCCGSIEHADIPVCPNCGVDHTDIIF